MRAVAHGDNPKIALWSWPDVAGSCASINALTKKGGSRLVPDNPSLIWQLPASLTDDFAVWSRPAAVKLPVSTTRANTSIR
jgi:hypothetical protein